MRKKERDIVSKRRITSYRFPKKSKRGLIRHLKKRKLPYLRRGGDRLSSEKIMFMATRGRKCAGKVLLNAGRLKEEGNLGGKDRSMLGELIVDWNAMKLHRNEGV